MIKSTQLNEVYKLTTSKPFNREIKIHQKVKNKLRSYEKLNKH